MIYKARCFKIACEEYGKVRYISEEDEDRGWNYCFSCEGLLEEVGEYDEFEQGQTEAFTCPHSSCVSNGDLVYLNLMQLEQCQNYCDVCGQEMLEYAKYNFPGLDDDGLGPLEDENQVDISELMDRNTSFGVNVWPAVRKGIQSCLQKGKNWGRSFKVDGNSLVETTPEKKNEYPVVYMSSGLKTPSSE